MFVGNPLLPFIFLLATSILAGTMTALVHLGRLEGEELLKKSRGFFFDHFLDLFFRGKKWDGLLFSLSFTKQVARLFYAILALFYLITHPPFSQVFDGPEKGLDLLWTLAITGIIVGVSLFADFLLDLIAVIRPRAFFTLFSTFSSLLLTLCLPFTAPFFKILKIFLPSLDKKKRFFRLKDKILDILQESELKPHLDQSDQKLILSVASFKERVAREVMVPRIDIFSLSAETTVEEAAKIFLEEGYSRIPVYEETVDHIIGVLLYKDILKVYVQSPVQNRQTPIATLVKPILYTPETKKISYLLQEFRTKQIHLAIVVDEYGGTEGIVTIEDILEELVGEIADEYDIEEEMLYSILTGGGWIIDARMTIIDIEEDLGIKIPSSPEYDTIGGYVYHRAGAIPSKGWRLHHDDFDLEILSSDERSIDKIRVTPN